MILYDDVITHDPLSWDIACYVQLYAFYYFRMTEQIFMKFGMDVMPLEATSNSYYLY
jgi:hypothetical protein